MWIKAYNFETLLCYVFKRLSFSSRVRVMGHWDWYADDIPPGSRMRVTFYPERMAKKDIRQIDDLNGTGIFQIDLFKKKRGITVRFSSSPCSSALTIATFRIELNTRIYQHIL